MATILAYLYMNSTVSQLLTLTCFSGRTIRDGDWTGQGQWPLNPGLRAILLGPARWKAPVPWGFCVPLAAPVRSKVPPYIPSPSWPGSPSVSFPTPGNTGLVTPPSPLLGSLRSRSSVIIQSSSHSILQMEGLRPREDQVVKSLASTTSPCTNQCKASLGPKGRRGLPSVA